MALSKMVKTVTVVAKRAAKATLAVIPRPANILPGLSAMTRTKNAVKGASLHPARPSAAQAAVPVILKKNVPEIPVIVPMIYIPRMERHAAPICSVLVANAPAEIYSAKCI